RPGLPLRLEPRPLRAGGRARRGARVQHRPLRPNHDGAPRRALPPPAGGGGGRPVAPRGGDGAAVAGRAAAGGRRAERHGGRLLGAGRDAEPLLHRWIERQAALTPGATAVVGESESLTYRELDARANRLARRLRRLGVRVDEPVAICADRSPALIVGLLAILKAGGAYLPLDPSYPSERLAFMIEDGLDGVAKPVLLAQVDLLAASVAGAGARVIDLDSAAGPAGDADDPLLAPLDGGAGADNLAY